MKPDHEVIGPHIKEGTEPLARGFALLTLTRVCSIGTPEEAEAWLREFHPAGTSGNWHLATEEHRQPVPCHDDPDHRKHYMFVC